MAAPVPPLRPITHLLLDTERLYSVVFQETCDRYEKTYTWDVKSQALEAAQVILDVLQLPMSKDELVEDSQAKLQDVFPTAALMPGLENLAHHLRRHHVLLRWPPAPETKTSAHKEFFSLFDHIVLGDDPEVRMARRTQSYISPVRRGSCLLPPWRSASSEDTPNRVEAALAAGMHVVMVPDGHLHGGLTTQVTVVLQDFQPELFGLPACE